MLREARVFQADQSTMEKKLSISLDRKLSVSMEKNPELLVPDSSSSQQNEERCIFDFLASFFCAALPVTCAWKGLWILLDAAIWPNNTLPSAWTSLVIGFVAVYLNTFLREALQDACFSHGSGLGRRFLARFFIMLMWIGVVNKWRGIFLLMDTDSGLAWRSYLLFLSAGLVVLLKLRLLATAAVALPLDCSVDEDDTFFFHETPFAATREDGYQVRCLDAFLAVVITCCSTFFWRGIWGVLDKIVLPQLPGWSALISLGVGFVICGMCYTLQYPVLRRLQTLHFGWALFFRTILVLTGTIGVINIWRGVFLFFDTYLTTEFFEQPECLLLAAAVASCCVLLLMLLRLSRNLLLWGVQRDMPYSIPFNCAVSGKLSCGGTDSTAGSESSSTAQP